MILGEGPIRLDTEYDDCTLQKGDSSVCGNWHGIRLLSMPGMLISHPILIRIQSRLGDKLRDR